MIKIGEFSKMARTTIKTLRFYDALNIFKPVYVDYNGYRYYDEFQLSDLVKIINYRSLDLPIEKIKEILDGKDEKEILKDHIKYLEEEKNKKIDQISTLKKLLKGDIKMEFKPVIKTIPKQFVYFRHGVIDSIDNMFDFVLQAGEECGKLNPGLKCTGYCYVTYTAGEYKEKDVELEYVEACLTKGVESENIKFREEPEVKVLSIDVKGAYSNLFNAYAFILKYIKENNLEIDGPLREVYIHGCWDKTSEDDYLTQIEAPIK